MYIRSHHKSDCFVPLIGSVNDIIFVNSEKIITANPSCCLIFLLSKTDVAELFENDFCHVHTSATEVHITSPTYTQSPFHQL